jgi:hypothetical protein
MLLDSRSGFPVVADRPTSSPILRFSAELLKKDLAKARDNLSAVVLRDNRLWLGGDEGTSIDRMTRDPSGTSVTTLVSSSRTCSSCPRQRRKRSTSKVSTWTADTCG